jgi:hypothetical protein
MADIQLSSELIEDIQNAVARQHPDANQGTVMQYLGAVTGYILASQSQMDEQTRNKFLEDLFVFIRHVVADVVANQAPQQAATEDAVGIWEPSKD